MNILYVYAHPNPTSFNAELKHAAIDQIEQLGVETKVSDLYAEHFKSVADNHDFTAVDNIDPQYFIAQKEAFEQNHLTTDISNELDKITWADHIIFQFPLWWFSAPAIMKGWFDRIFIKGFAYDAGRMFSDGLLKNKTASFTVTTQSPETAYTSEGMHAHSLEAFLLPMTHTLHFAGIKTYEPFTIYSAFDLTDHDVKHKIHDYKEYLTKLIQNAP